MKNKSYEEKFCFSKLPYDREAETIHIQCYFDSVWYSGFTATSASPEIAVYSYVKSGCACSVWQNGKQLSAPAGSFVASPNHNRAKTATVSSAEPWVRKSIIIDRNPFYDFLANRFFPNGTTVIPLYAPDKIERILDAIHAALLKEKEDAAELSALFLQLLCEVSAQAPQHEKPEPLHTALAYIQLHFREEQLDKNAIAAAAGVSLRTLERLFRTFEVSSPMKTVRELRLEHAEKLLRSSYLSIKEIAAECGFSSANYFSRQFRLCRGETPQEYRQKYKIMY